MDELAWDRCPECLGRLDALDVGGAAALGCLECGYVGQSVAVPVHHALPSGDAAFPGF